MAKDRRKLQHIHSSIKDRQPTPATLEVGEIAVNNNADNEFLSLKNSNDRVVRFSSDEQLVTIMEKKEVMPYVGYVRGGAGPSATAEGSTADTYGSYGIENSDLINNTSEIIIKLNQVAADNTTKHDKVNGAKDKYSKDVNPTTDGGLNDGAGFFIDMSRYAMQDANPRFSGITNTCYTTLNGTTKIHGLTGDCGSLLDIKIDTANSDIETATTEITIANTTIGTNDITISGDTTLKVSGTTTETKKGDVTENNLANKVENTTSDYTVNTTGITSMNSTGNTCITSQADADFYGKDNTKVGVACDGSVTTKVTAQGNDVVIDATTNNVGITAKNDIDASAENDININANNDICETAGVNASFYAVTRTNLGINCDNSSSSTTTNLYGDTVNEVANTMNVTATTLNEEIGTETKHTSATTTITRDGDVTENNKNNVTVNITGNTVVNTTGTTDIISTGTTTIESNGVGSDMCISAADVAGFVGTNKTNIGKNCADGGQTTTLNINGDTINETGTTLNISGSSDVNVQGGIQVCISAGTKANLYAPETNVGVSCEGSTATTVNVSGTTINEGGTTINETFTDGTLNITNYDLNGDKICISGTTNANIYGATTNIGADCDGTTTATTVNITGATINEGGTTKNEAFTDINVTATTTTNTGDVNISGVTTIGDTLVIKKGLEKTLSWSYGDVQSATADSTNFKDDKSFVIPQCAGDIKRRTLSWSNGAANSGSYDPGASCTNTADGTNIVIPSGLSHLTDWDGSCLKVPGCLQASTVYQTSDENLKENIDLVFREDFDKVQNVHIKSFNFKDDETKRKTYGVIAQDVENAGLEELVYTKEDGYKAVDYTSMLILKIAYLEDFCAHLNGKLEDLKNKINELENKA